MDSRFQFKFTSYFLKQWKGYDKRTKDLVQEKINLIKQNPFRFPRLMYAVFMPDTKHITILGVFDRSASYKDFERLFKDLRK